MLNFIIRHLIPKNFLQFLDVMMIRTQGDAERVGNVDTFIDKYCDAEGASSSKQAE